MWNVRVGPRLAQAGAAVAMLLSSLGSAWAVGGTISGTYQDQVNITTNKKDVDLLFKFDDAAVLVNTVSCTIEATTPPFEVQLAQKAAAGVLVFIPVSFSGQTASKNVFTAFANNLGYGIQKGGRAEMKVRWPANGSYSVICSIIGKKI